MKKGRFFSENPQPGDLVIFDFGSKPKGSVGQHIGIVEAVLPKGVQTIEGNTTTGIIGSQDNGGCVARRKRTTAKQIVGYCRPEYVDAKPITHKTVKSGSKGADVYTLQTLLNAKGYDCGSVDGDFGPKTKDALTAYQVRATISIDGIAGPETWKFLLK